LLSVRLLLNDEGEGLPVTVLAKKIRGIIAAKQRDDAAAHSITSIPAASAGLCISADSLAGT
jgi:hypothetical protein